MLPGMRTALPILAAVLLIPAWSAAADPIAGRWPSGYWASESSGHRGTLRAAVTPTPTGYDVRFAGRFAKVIPFTYRSHLNVVGTAGDTVFLAAERRLPVFGTFRMDAVATPTSFDAAYHAKRDHGRFVLSR